MICPGCREEGRTEGSQPATLYIVGGCIDGSVMIRCTGRAPAHVYTSREPGLCAQWADRPGYPAPKASAPFTADFPAGVL